uniref:Insulin receptor substrate 2-B-like n=1 Tax=Knipowitschia caucasica TaxID=637954 RepID=A0AAV2KNU4_KNICA
MSMKRRAEECDDMMTTNDAHTVLRGRRVRDVHSGAAAKLTRLKSVRKLRKPTINRLQTPDTDLLRPPATLWEEKDPKPRGLRAFRPRIWRQPLRGLAPLAKHNMIWSFILLGNEPHAEEQCFRLSIELLKRCVWKAAVLALEPRAGGGTGGPRQLPPSGPLQLGSHSSHDPGDSGARHTQVMDEAPACSSHVFASVNTDSADDIRKCGYLRKQKHGHKRFFVLRAASHLGPSRLEYYDSEKKFRSSLRTPAPTLPSSPKRVIYLYQCFTVNKRADAKNKHLIALYTKDEYFAMVAESEAEQEDWYVAVSALMNQGKKGHADELDDGYGTVTPATVFKEVWQVNVKPKGLGQTKALTGVYRLCLSTKTLHLVKLNCETPCVTLPLMNIRRCGHSESFFFIEVGRSSSTGPGELWMQVEDSVVAQNMHETILETMKALKAFAEFRPRSKSQSSGSNPMPFITTRRHLGNLPPSQTGLQRRSRTESVVGTPPCKSSGASGYRFRTSSEGEGTMNRPLRSATGSLIQLNLSRAQGRQESAAGARYVRAVAHHARSASLPVSHFPSAPSPSGPSPMSQSDTRPSSASLCGSPSDGGFNSSDEYGSSPGDFRYFRVRSNTPDSLGNTPPIREELSDYMSMGWSRDVFVGGESGREAGGADEEDSSVRRRTHSCSRPTGGAVPVLQKTTQTNFCLDECADALPFGALLRGRPSSSSSSLRSDYSSCSEHSQSRQAPPPEDSGYVPMQCGVASPRDTDYMPMMPSHSPLLSRVAPPPHADGYMMMLPGGGAPNGEYMDMSYSGGGAEGSHGPSTPEATPTAHNPYFSLPRSYKTPTRETDEYVPMRSPASSAPSPAHSTPAHPPPPYSAHHTTAAMLDRRMRPCRLPLGRRSFHGPIRASESTPGPAHSDSSPGEYINIQFEPLPHQQQPPAYPHSNQAPPTYPHGNQAQPIYSHDDQALPTYPHGNQALPTYPHGECPQDYMCLQVGSEPPPKSPSPRPSLVAPWNPPSYIRPGAGGAAHWSKADDYADMSPTAMLQRLCLLESQYSAPASPGAAAVEPKVVRADPQGRRRHSSETFTNAPGTSATAAANHGAANGACPPEGQASRWSSASFDSVWMSVEASPVTSDLCLSPVTSASSSSSSSSGVRTGANFQNGLNYIALELRDESSGPDTPTTTGATPTATTASGTVPAEAPPLPESAAYARIDLSHSDQASSTRD